jgi:hypothetical protein
LLVGGFGVGAWLFAGPIDGSEAAARFVGLETSWFGRAIAGPGDMDDDGIDDIAVGAPADDDVGPQAGAVYLFPGDPAWVAGAEVVVDAADAGARLTGIRRDRAGGALAAAGDLDGDGRADLWVSGRREGQDDAGAVWGVGYASGTLDALAVARFDGPGPDDRAGTSLAVGDVDADGVTDLLIGGRRATGEVARSGVVWLVYGPFGGVTDLADADARVLGDTAEGGFGRAVAAGDLDGDDAAEVIAGAVPAGAWMFRGGACP